tara:strand:+ start:2137 stop:2403 length:267 start_codon:yes stop_codon:yes gene_type:complete
MKTNTTNEEWKVCDTCANYIANGDATSLDYYYQEEEAAKILDTMNKNLEEAQGHAVLSSEEPYGFSNYTCDCCESQAGDRHIVKFISI